MNLLCNSIPIDQDPPKQPYGSLLSSLAIIAHCQKQHNQVSKMYLFNIFIS